MKINSHLAPVDMTYTIELKGLTQEQGQRVTTLAAEMAREQGEELDLSRVLAPAPHFRRIDA